MSIFDRKEPFGGRQRGICNNPNCRAPYFVDTSQVPGFCPVCSMQLMELWDRHQRYERAKPDFWTRAHRKAEAICNSTSQASMRGNMRGKFRPVKVRGGVRAR